MILFIDEVVLKRAWAWAKLPEVSWRNVKEKIFHVNWVYFIFQANMQEFLLSRPFRTKIVFHLSDITEKRKRIHIFNVINHCLKLHFQISRVTNILCMVAVLWWRYSSSTFCILFYVFFIKVNIQLDNRLQVLTLLSPCRDSQTATKQSEFWLIFFRTKALRKRRSRLFGMEAPGSEGAQQVRRPLTQSILVYILGENYHSLFMVKDM